MYYLTKIFEMPIGHRLSKLEGSKCVKFHGHNFKIEVTIRSKYLNDNDMVMDFSRLKELVLSIIDSWDHGMFLNMRDKKNINEDLCTVHYTTGDPTAEKLCEYLYYELNVKIPHPIEIYSVAMWETSESKAMYKEEL